MVGVFHLDLLTPGIVPALNIVVGPAVHVTVEDVPQRNGKRHRWKQSHVVVKDVVIPLIVRWVTR